ncbi:MAG TPA: type II toxin-antitoxin system VapC family toxin [Vicinamibacteria bacterium]
MIRYFDASALVKRYVAESGSDTVRKLLGDGLACTSRLSEVEIASALVRRARDRSISERDRDRALSALTIDFDVLYVVELSARIATLARRFLLQNRLRAGDAIQLASCVFVQESTVAPVTFVASDEGLNQAAAKSGLALSPVG